MLSAIFHSPDMPSPRPVLDDDLQSNIPGVYVIGDLSGAPVVKLAMEQGFRVAHSIAGRKMQPREGGICSTCSSSVPGRRA